MFIIISTTFTTITIWHIYCIITLYYYNYYYYSIFIFFNIKYLLK
jgi:hypothetical protein